MAVSGSEWLQKYGEMLGVAPPDAGETDALLAMTGMAAHASERTAAPLSAWLVGRAGITPAQAKALAARLADELDRESLPEDSRSAR